MDARAKAAKNPEQVEEQFIYWAKYFADNVAYDASIIKTEHDYASELKGLTDIATAIYAYLLSPAGAHHNNADDIVDFQCGMECVQDQIIAALNAAPIPNKAQAFAKMEYAGLIPSLRDEWVGIKGQLNKLYQTAEANAAKENTSVQVVASQPEQPSSVTKPVTPKFTLKAALNFLPWSKPLPAGGGRAEEVHISRPVKVGS